MGHRSQRARRWRHAALAVGMLLTVVACGLRRASGETIPDAAGLTGLWELDVDPPADDPTFRPWITIAVDSVRSGVIHGRLLHYVVGNVGANADDFPHLDGRVDHGDTVRAEIRHADPTMLGLRFVGRVAGDTVRLDTLVVGPQVLVGDGQHWLLVRHR